MFSKRKIDNYKLKFIILTAMFIVVFFTSFMVGRYKIYPFELVKILLSRLFDTINNIFPSLKSILFMEKTWDTSAETIVFNIRLPRIIAAALIGGALSASGAAYQGMFRNPMVSPDILGASSASGFGAALGILLSFDYLGISLSAFLFGLGAVLAAYFLSRMRGNDSTLSMVLAGMMISSLFSSGTSFIKLVADTQSQLPAITYWLMGSLSSIKTDDVLFLLAPVIIGILPLIIFSWRINLLTTSEEEAKSMGINTRALKTVVIISATLMTASCVAVSGMIGWVGLVIPHFCRRIFGYDYRRIIPSSLLLGSTFLVFTDTISRTVTTSEIPLGILTSFVGAPVFIYMIMKKGEQHEY